MREREGKSDDQLCTTMKYKYSSCALNSVCSLDRDSSHCNPCDGQQCVPVKTVHLHRLQKCTIHIYKSSINIPYKQAIVTGTSLRHSHIKQMCINCKLYQHIANHARNRLSRSFSITEAYKNHFKGILQSDHFFMFGLFLRVPFSHLNRMFYVQSHGMARALLSGVQNSQPYTN